MAELAPTVADVVVWSDQITPYDERHFLTYARLLDADREDADWRDVARIILLLDPEESPERTRRCWQTHLERAKWVATTGYQQLIDQAELRSKRN
jgi:hypothetical protein